MRNLYYEREYWDLYDRNEKRVGKIQRGAIWIPGGLYHKSVEVVPTDMHGHILITQRSFSKKFSPGKYEFPAGSVHAGEEPYKAALRELREETGLRANKLFHIQTEKTPYRPDKSGLIRYTFAAQIDDLLTAEIQLLPSETIDYQIITLKELHLNYLSQGKFDESRISFYREDFYERLEKLIGIPEVEENTSEPLKSPEIPKLQFVKSSLRGSAAFKAAALAKEVSQNNE